MRGTTKRNVVTRRKMMTTRRRDMIHDAVEQVGIVGGIHDCGDENEPGIDVVEVLIERQ
ncbi:hypothetical protein M513_14352 [Trichuris suis]|uniref:Uncharacterized protein n=1 Tax=Trichuris suis TaxID=68888 RepID=A0A085LIH4_9BILA|nr:hypothetical protein M513_14352 [Trichuris suis]